VRGEAAAILLMVTDAVDVVAADRRLLAFIFSR
jgi:hypothetical protein